MSKSRTSYKDTQPSGSWRCWTQSSPRKAAPVWLQGPGWEGLLSWAGALPGLQLIIRSLCERLCKANFKVTWRPKEKIKLLKYILCDFLKKIYKEHSALPLGEGVCLIAQTPLCSSLLLFLKQLSADGFVRVARALSSSRSLPAALSSVLPSPSSLRFSAILFLHTLSPLASVLNDTLSTTWYLP